MQSRLSLPGGVGEQGRSTLPGSRAYAFKSQIVDQEFLIEVAYAGQASADRPAPVLYVLDSNSVFATVVQIVRMLQSGPHGLPPLIVVGVGYRFNKARSVRAQFVEARTRDYAPSVDRPWTDLSTRLLAEEGNPVDLKPGGAERFLAFIANELKPFIASCYVVDAGDQCLVGASLGGLFALHTLFTAPDAFRRYITISPALWWDDRCLFRAEAASAASASDLPVHLFLAVGALEEADGAPYFPVSQLEEMRRRLEERRYPNLRMMHHVFPEETHMSVYPVAVTRGLREIFVPAGNALAATE
jgi:hypothetical protein